MNQAMCKTDPIVFLDDDVVFLDDEIIGRDQKVIFLKDEIN